MTPSTMKRIFEFGWMLLILFQVLLSLSGDVASAADVPYMERTIRERFSTVRNHVVDPDAKESAQSFIYEAFQRLGLAAEYNSFQYDDYFNSLWGKFGNVVGVLKGTRFGTAADRLIGIGAHFDTVHTSGGVNDNGSGMAAMLEAARQVARMRVPRNNTVLFVAFDIKEYGFIGSGRFIETWLYPWLVQNYGEAAYSVVPHGAIVLDTLLQYNTTEFSQTLPHHDIMKTLWPEAYTNLESNNFRGDFQTITYRAQTPDDALAGAFQVAWNVSDREQFKLVSLPLPSMNTPGLTDNYGEVIGNFMRSDQASFWSNNIPSVIISDTCDLRGAMQRCYHQMCDDVETMLTEENLQFLAKTADAVSIAVNRLAEAGEDNGSPKVLSSAVIETSPSGHEILTFSCEASGEPRPTITMYRDDTVITDVSEGIRDDGQANVTVKIHTWNLTATATATLRCHASNGVLPDGENIYYLVHLGIQQVGPTKALVRVVLPADFDPSVQQLGPTMLRGVQNVEYDSYDYEDERSIQIDLDDTMTAMIYDIDRFESFFVEISNPEQPGAIQYSPEVNRGVVGRRTHHTLQPRSSDALVLSDAVGKVYEAKNGKSASFVEANRSVLSDVRLQLSAFHRISTTYYSGGLCPDTSCGVLQLQSYKYSGLLKTQVSFMFTDYQDFLWAKAHM